MSTPTDKKSASAGHFEFRIDGHKPTAYIKSIEGGLLRGNVVDEPIGGNSETIKGIATREIEPITLEFGFSAANDVLHWIQDSWEGCFSRRNGEVNHADFDKNITFNHQFSDALISEVTF